MAKHEIFKAMGSLAYAMAMADGEIQVEEKETIRKLALSQFELSDIDNAWITTMFDDLSKKKISVEEAYNFALDVLEANRFSFEFDEVMKKKCLKFIEKTAEAFEGMDYSERAVMSKLRKDLERF